MTESDHIRAFFNETRTAVLKVSAIERLAGLADTKVLDNFLSGRRPLPKARIPAIVAVLRQFGYSPLGS